MFEFFGYLTYRCDRVEGRRDPLSSPAIHLSSPPFWLMVPGMCLPSVGLSRIWKAVGSLSSRAVGGRTDLCSDPDSPAMRTLREEQVNCGIVPVSVPMLLGVDEIDLMNGPFLVLEFSAPLGSCSARSAYLYVI